MSERESMEALLRKGRRLFALCRETDDDQCVIGFVDYNLRQGGERRKMILEFSQWLQIVVEHGNPEDRDRAQRILARVQKLLGESLEP